VSTTTNQSLSETEWLSDAQVEQIEAAFPKCPECGADIAYVHMVAHQLYRLSYDIDAGSGDVLISTEHYDTTFTVAEQDYDHRQTVMRYVVECENRHEWPTDRLSYQFPQGRGRREWRVVS
jgi:uncharacterized protein (DUF1684 family)